LVLLFLIKKLKCWTNWTVTNRGMKNCESKWFIALWIKLLDLKSLKWKKSLKWYIFSKSIIINNFIIKIIPVSYNLTFKMYLITHCHSRWWINKVSPIAFSSKGIANFLSTTNELQRKQYKYYSTLDHYEWFYIFKQIFKWVYLVFQIENSVRLIIKNCKVVRLSPLQNIELQLISLKKSELLFFFYIIS
jgi:hypothetical protein